MSDDQIKDILIELIRMDKVYLGNSNEEIAENMAKFVNTMIKETRE